MLLSMTVVAWAREMGYKKNQEYREENKALITGIKITRTNIKNKKETHSHQTTNADHKHSMNAIIRMAMIDDTDTDTDTQTHTQ